MKTVLLTAIGSASAHSAQQSLRAMGCRTIGCDIYPKAWNVNAADFDEFFNVPLATDAAAYADALLRESRARGVTHLIPLTDVEVDALCARKADFAAVGTTVCCPDADVTDRCRDKLRMAHELAAAKIAATIPTYTRDTLPASLDYPLMVKPLRGRSSQHQTVVHNERELAQALSARDDLLVQPFLSGDIYTVDCARDAFGTVVTVARHELLRTVNGLGTAVEICPTHPLNAVVRRIAEFAGVVGVVNMEFIEHDGAYFFLEVNPRFSGGVGFSKLAGYDFARAMLLAHDGDALEPLPAMKPLVIAQRYEMSVTDAME